MTECKTVKNAEAAAKLLHDCTGGYKQELSITEVSETIVALRDLSDYLESLTTHLRLEINRNQNSALLYVDQMKTGDLEDLLYNAQEKLSRSSDACKNAGDSYNSAFNITHHVGYREFDD